MNAAPCPTKLEMLIDQALAWAAQDPDPETRAELTELVTAAHHGDVDAQHELADRFAGRLQFGTAGLRGELGAGPNRMNHVVVAHAAAGLASYLNSSVERTPAVVIGYDGRKNSKTFAALSAAILAGAGARVQLMPSLTPTPVLAFAVRHLQMDAGIMVTASHNPASDNGYKVYLGGADGGSQIISPSDEEISAHIEQAAHTKVLDLPHGEYETVPAAVLDAYVQRTSGLVPVPAAQLRVVHTAMHGVATAVFDRVLKAAGFSPAISVTVQADPDPAFPTVAFPNPEEAGALEHAFATARETAADLIIAHDPDADRLAVAIPDSSPEGYRRLTGNEVGLLLGWWIARTSQANDWVYRPDTTDRAFACSIVSSPALKIVAEAYGLNHCYTLTGFKWISRAPGLLFGFEEALGYLVDPEAVHDKDGISASMLFLSMASSLAGQGQTVQDALDAFSMRFGHHLSEQVSLRVDGLSQLMERLRSTDVLQIGGSPVVAVTDFLEGAEGLPASNLLRYQLDDGTRVMVRPSGTEPKLKVYVDVVSTAGDLAQRKVDAAVRRDLIISAMTELLA